jgi:hypothetical protein
VNCHPRIALPRPDFCRSTMRPLRGADANPISPDNPVAVAEAFLSFLSKPGGPNVENLALVVTPESFPAWGDFTAAAEMLRGCGMMSRANHSDDSAVVYVGYPTDHDGRTYQAQSDTVIAVRAVATLRGVRTLRVGGCTAWASTCGPSRYRISSVLESPSY